jgi:hypothetical protein
MLPIRFEYVDEAFGLKEKKFVTVLGEHTHHYTGKKFIRIREEFESGYIQEYMVTAETMKLMLSKRVEVSE